MSKVKLTIVDLTLVGSTFCPTGYGEAIFDTIKAAKAWIKNNGYLIDLNLTHASDLEGLHMDIYTKRTAWDNLHKIYLERI